VSTLTAKKRNGLSNAVFAVPSRRAFPINDKAHATAALRLIGHAHSPAEKTRIRAKAHAMLDK